MESEGCSLSGCYVNCTDHYLIVIDLLSIQPVLKSSYDLFLLLSGVAT